MTSFDQLPSPRVVCLCGSTRFGSAFQHANLFETLAGRVVLSIGCDTKSNDQLEAKGFRFDKEMLDWLHLRKIDMADEVLILNVCGYIGVSTRRELEYAVSQGKRVRWLQPCEAPLPYRAGRKFTSDIVVIWRSAVLLVKRRNPPYADMWALPGGHVDPSETFRRAAARELYEEAGVSGFTLLEVATFDDPHRDPRGRYVSTAFFVHIPAHMEPAPVAGDDAKEVKWLPLELLSGFPLAFDHERIIQCTLAQPFMRSLWEVEA